MDLVFVVDYQKNLVKVYSIIYEKAIEKFPQDDEPTLENFMMYNYLDGRLRSINNRKEKVK